MSRRVKILFALALAAIVVVGAGLTADRAATMVSARAAEDARVVLTAGGHDWASVSADGLIVTVRGEAPNEALRSAALSRIAALAQPLTILDETRAAPPPVVERAAPRLEILSEPDGLTLLGRAPDQAMQTAFAKAVHQAAPGRAISDLTRSPAAPGGPHWQDAQSMAGRIAAGLLYGRVRVSGQSIRATGVADGDQAARDLNALAGPMGDTGWMIETDIVSPDPEKPVPLLVAHSRAGKVVLDECTVAALADAAALRAEAEALSVDSRTECETGADDDPEFAAASSAGLAALSTLPRAGLRLTGRTLRLNSASPTRARALEAAEETLRQTLPPGFLLVVDGAALPTQTGQGDDAADSGTNVVAVTRDSEGRAQLSGTAPTAAEAKVIAAVTALKLRGVTVTGALDTRPASPHPGWRTAILGAVTALAQLSEGQVTVGGDVALVEGVAASPAVIRQVHRALSAAMTGTWRAETRLTVYPGQIADLQPVPLARCIEKLNAIAAETPILFEPASAEITAESQNVASRMANIVPGCEGGRIEVGGHTDSQGSAAANMALSRARAEAVLDALLAAGAPITLLTARGYGEERPIADNGTEAGRALNRRIAFSVREEPDARSDEVTE